MRRPGLAVATALLAASLLAVGCSSPSSSTADAHSTSNTNSTSTGITVNNGPTVSTMKPGKRFTAVPDFSDFQGCGRPCWLPLYAQPWETPPAVTHGWPCEYYDPTSSDNGPYCLHPPANRSRNQMGDSSDPNSGDRVLVLCQTTTLPNGRPAQTIRNEAGQESDVWDKIAVPTTFIAPLNPPMALMQVPGTEGYFYEAYAPDIWLLNSSMNTSTGRASLRVHNIPCSQDGS